MKGIEGFGSVWDRHNRLRVVEVEGGDLGFLSLKRGGVERDN